VDAGGYLRITDRKKDMILVGGFNVIPAEVERILPPHQPLDTTSATI
jgi:acyl-CoA synthetase (AMP-forming)/AMP-acid ligase II